MCKKTTQKKAFRLLVLFGVLGLGFLGGFLWGEHAWSQQLANAAKHLSPVISFANAMDVLGFLVAIVTISLVYKQLSQMNNINRMEISYQLYKENTEKRRLHGNARDQLQRLEERLKTETVTNRNDFDKIYADNEYTDLRDLSYHFEYIGHLVKSRRVHFKLIFDPITFPDWLIEDSKYLREVAQLYLDDFWVGIEYLYTCYSKARAKLRKDKIVQQTYQNRRAISRKPREVNKRLESAFEKEAAITSDNEMHSIVNLDNKYAQIHAMKEQLKGK